MSEEPPLLVAYVCKGLADPSCSLSRFWCDLIFMVQHSKFCETTLYSASDAINKTKKQKSANMITIKIKFIFNLMIPIKFLA